MQDERREEGGRRTRPAASAQDHADRGRVGARMDRLDLEAAKTPGKAGQCLADVR